MAENPGLEIGQKLCFHMRSAGIVTVFGIRAVNLHL